MSHAPNSPDNHDAIWQVSYLKNEKGLTFDLISEDDAIDFLKDMTFFFKIKSFAKNYEKRLAEGSDQGKYINLDFGYLVELSRLDVHIRSAVLLLSLDIEHYLKVRINKSAMANNIDPCALTENYLEYVAQVARTDIAQTCKSRQPQTQIHSAIQALEAISETTAPDEMVSGVNKTIDCLEELTGGKRPDERPYKTQQECVAKRREKSDCRFRAKPGDHFPSRVGSYSYGFCGSATLL